MSVYERLKSEEEARKRKPLSRLTPGKTGGSVLARLRAEEGDTAPRPTVTITTKQTTDRHGRPVGKPQVKFEMPTKGGKAPSLWLGSDLNRWDMPSRTQPAPVTLTPSSIAPALILPSRQPVIPQRQPGQILAGDLIKGNIQPFDRVPLPTRPFSEVARETAPFYTGGMESFRNIIPPPGVPPPPQANILAALLTGAETGLLRRPQPSGDIQHDIAMSSLVAARHPSTEAMRQLQEENVGKTFLWSVKNFLKHPKVVAETIGQMIGGMGPEFVVARGAPAAGTALFAIKGAQDAYLASMADDLQRAEPGIDLRDESQISHYIETHPGFMPKATLRAMKQGGVGAAIMGAMGGIPFLRLPGSTVGKVFANLGIKGAAQTGIFMGGQEVSGRIAGRKVTGAERAETAITLLPFLGMDVAQVPRELARVSRQRALPPPTAPVARAPELPREVPPAPEVRPVVPVELAPPVPRPEVAPPIPAELARPATRPIPAPQEARGAAKAAETYIDKHGIERYVGVTKSPFTQAERESFARRDKNIAKLTSLSREELQKLHDDAVKQEGAEEVMALGEKGAQEWRTLQRQQNSSNNQVSDKASKRIDEIEASLTPEQHRILFGIGDERPSADNIKDLIDAVDYIDVADSPAELSRRVGRAIILLGGETDPTKMDYDQRRALAQLSHAGRITEERGYNAEEVLEGAFKSAAGEIRDPQDIEMMLGDLWRSRAPQAQQRKALTAPQEARGEAKELIPGTTRVRLKNGVEGTLTWESAKTYSITGDDGRFYRPMKTNVEVLHAKEAGAGAEAAGAQEGAVGGAQERLRVRNVTAGDRLEAKPEAKAEVGKEPWQQTREEFTEGMRSPAEKSKRFKVQSPDKDRPYGATEIEFVPVRKNKVSGVYVKPIARNLKTGKEWQASSADITEVTGKSFYQNETQVLSYRRLNDWLAGRLSTDEAATTLYKAEELVPSHHRQVEQALSEGKPVPESVLADYPDLSPKQPAQAKPAAEAVGKGRGSPFRAKTVTGKVATGQYEVLEAGDLIQSHNLDFSRNPQHTREYQGRDFDAARQTYVKHVAANLDPEQVNVNIPVTTDGPPLIDSRNVTLGGNARAIAIKMRYAENTNDAYRQDIIDRSGEFGLDPKAVAAMKEPLLVRRVTSPFPSEGDKIAFARDTDISNTQNRTVVELARADAEKLTPEILSTLHPDENGDMNTRDNQLFLTSFIKRIGDTELQSMMTKDGRLSQDGVRRVQAAVLQKAYGNSSLVDLAFLETDAGAKNLFGALVELAPKAIKHEQASRLLGEAASYYYELRRGGGKLDVIDQLTLTGEGMTADAARLLKTFSASKSKKALVENLGRYLEEVTGGQKEMFAAVSGAKQASWEQPARERPQGEMFGAAEINTISAISEKKPLTGIPAKETGNMFAEQKPSPAPAAPKKAGGTVKPSIIDRLSPEEQAALDILRKPLRGAVGKLPEGGASEEMVTRLKALHTVGKAFYREGLTDFKEWSAAIVENVGEWAKEHLDDIYARVSGKPVEGKEREVVGIFYRNINADRAKHNLPPFEHPEISRPHQQVLDDAQRIIEKNPMAGESAVEDILLNQRAFKDDTEVGLAIHRENQLRNARDIASAEEREAQAAGDKQGVIEATARINSLSVKITEIGTAILHAGASTRTARTLSALSISVNPDFSRAELERQVVDAQHGRPLTEAQLREVERTADDIKAKNTALERVLVEKESEITRIRKDILTLEQAVEKAKQARTKTKRPVLMGETPQPRAQRAVYGAGNKIVTTEQYVAMRERMLARMARTSSAPMLDPEALADLVGMATYHIESLSRSSYGAIRDKLREELPGIREGHIRQVYDLATNEKALAIHKRRLSRELAKWTARTEAGDYERIITRRELLKDPEAEHLAFQLDEAKHKWYEGRLKQQWKEMGALGKVLTGGREAIALQKAFMIADIGSAFMRQGGPITVAHPIMSSRSFLDMLRAFRSRAAEHRIMNEIRQDDLYEFAARSGFEFTTSGSIDLTKSQEYYQSHWAQKVPLVAGAERAFSTLLNSQGFNLFKLLVNARGGRENTTLAEGKLLANMIMVSQGRGDVGKFKAAAAAVAPFTFAGPRYYVSRIQMLWRTATLGQARLGISPSMRRMLATETLRSLAGFIAIEALMTAVGAKLGKDALNTDWGKAIFGRLRADFAFGMQQFAVFFYRLATGKASYGEDGKVQEANRMFTLLRFVRSKLGPAVGSVVDLLYGRDYTGKKLPESAAGKAGYLAQRNLTNIALSGAYQAAKANGISAGVFWGLMEQIGVGVSVFNERSSAGGRGSRGSRGGRGGRGSR